MWLHWKDPQIRSGIPVSIRQFQQYALRRPADAEIVPPKIAPCPPWQLVEQLDFEKEITGMYISGHPLDNFRFELTHYHITHWQITMTLKMPSGSARAVDLSGWRAW